MNLILVFLKAITNTKKIIFFSFLVFLLQEPGYASAIKSLVKFATNSNLTNKNKAAIISDQRGSYVTGGSIITRGARPEDIRPIGLQTPQLKYDPCTGNSDFRFGAISYISAKEFVQFLKGAAVKSSGYAVKLLLQTTCPQCADAVSYLETVTRDINGLMLDQCAAAQKIANGALNSFGVGLNQRCKMQSSTVGGSMDLFDVTQKCMDDPKRFGNSSEDELQNILQDEFNLVWQSLSSQNTDNDLMHLLMSVSGTIIAKNHQDRTIFIFKPSLVTNGDLLEEYIGLKENSSLKLYQCDENHKCLNPEIVDTKIDNTIYHNMEKTILTIIDKTIANPKDPNLSKEEELVISYSSIPIINLIEIESVKKSRKEDLIVRMTQTIEVICYDVITNFLLDLTHKVNNAVLNLEQVQISDNGKIVDRFLKQLNHTQNLLKQSHSESFKRLNIIVQLKERLEGQQIAFESLFGKAIANQKTNKNR